MLGDFHFNIQFIPKLFLGLTLFGETQALRYRVFIIREKSLTDIVQPILSDIPRFNIKTGVI